MENLDWLISSAGFRTAGTLPLDRLRRQIAVRNTAGPVSDIRNINFVGLQHAKLADGPGPEFGFGFCSGPYSDGCGSNSAIRTGKYFFYATNSPLRWAGPMISTMSLTATFRFGLVHFDRELSFGTIFLSHRCQKWVTRTCAALHPFLDSLSRGWSVGPFCRISLE